MTEKEFNAYLDEEAKVNEKYQSNSMVDSLDGADPIKQRVLRKSKAHQSWQVIENLKYSDLSEADQSKYSSPFEFYADKGSVDPEWHGNGKLSKLS